MRGYSVPWISKSDVNFDEEKVVSASEKRWQPEADAITSAAATFIATIARVFGLNPLIFGSFQPVPVHSVQFHNS